MQDERSDRPFLARPFWRDPILGGCIIGMGFLLSSPGLPLHGWRGLVVMAIGALMVLAATVTAGLWSLGRRAGGCDTPPAPLPPPNTNPHPPRGPSPYARRAGARGTIRPGAGRLWAGVAYAY